MGELDKVVNTQSQRVVSVDILRGVTIFLMIFANFGFMDAPWFMRHYNASAFAGVTYVDYVFSAFLLLVGVSIPLSFRKYDDSFKGRARLLRHVLVRGGSLLFLGMLYLNTPDVTAMGSFSWLNDYWHAMRLSPGAGALALWRLLVTLAVIMLFNRISVDDYRIRRLSLALKIVGAAFLVYYMIIFVPQHVQPLTEEQLAQPWWERALRCVFYGEGNWLRGPWWEILGLIGWAYMVAGVLYLCVRKYPELIYLSLAFLIIFSAAGAMGRFEKVNFLSRYWGYFGNHSILTMLGVGLGVMIQKIQTHRGMFGMLTRFFIVCLAITLVTTPWGGLEHGTEIQRQQQVYRFLFGLNKNWCTLGWIFSTGLFCSLLWMVFYYFCDVRGCRNFAVRFFASLGSVPLTAYIFQFFFFALISAFGLLDFRYDHDVCNMWTSMGISVAVTVLICLIAVLCRRWKFSLKL